MRQVETNENQEFIFARAAIHFGEHQQAVFRRTDRMFAWLMALQWVAGIAAALWISPKTWAGATSQTHIHVWAAIYLGGGIAFFPILLTFVRPGSALTRHTIAAAQMAASALLIHLTGGRIETHFHVFGSLAFLAFYRDWRLLVTASLITAVDHFARGVLWPESIYGVLTVSPWRWLEHAGWVIFADVFFTISILQIRKDMWQIAYRQVDLETANERIELKVRERTAELITSEERFRSLSAASPMGIIQLDETGRCVYTNERWCEITGMAREETSGSGWRRALHSKDRLAVTKEWLITARENREFSKEFRIRTAQQETRWVNLNFKPMFSDDGKVCGLVGTVMDITERKQAEGELRTQKEILQKIFDHIPLMINFIDENGRIKLINQEWERKLGWSLEEILTQNLDVFAECYPDPQYRQEVLNFVADSNDKWTDLKTRVKDGRVIDTSWTVVHLSDETFIGIGQDITERKRAEEAASLLAAIVESSEDAIFGATLDGAIISWNAAAERFYGYTAEEIKGSDVSMLAPPEHKDDKLKILEKVKQGEPTHQFKTIRQRKDGSFINVALTISPIRDGEGNITGVSTIAHDITERKQMEAQLESARDQALESARLKSEFLANMSHEIRTPMNGIIGMTSLALDTDLTDEQREYLNMVKSCSNGLLTVINDILDFSKIEAGKLDFDQVDFHLRDSLSDMLRALATGAHGKQLELLCRIDPDTPDRVIGDPDRLRQIINNLLGNAIKFTERGEIVVGAETESLTDNDITLHFSITDTGIGIPAEKQAIIFEAFTQADGSATRKYGGTGLGLAITSRLVEMMQGRIWVESEIGRGSAFHFTVKLGLQPDNAACLVRKAAASLRGLRVLIVDDNATNQRILEGILSRWQMKPAWVESGPAALELMKRAKALGEMFDLVLLDVCMPEMDGFAVAEQIQEGSELAGATVMMLSSLDLRGDAARSKSLGVSAYLVKPVIESKLLKAITSAMSARRANEESSANATGQSAKQSKKNFRILVAEDNPVNQRLAVRLLEKRGHTVAVVSTGMEAVQAQEEYLFDVILMDVQMPEMNGLEATVAIRAKERFSGEHVSIIAMTAHAMKGDRERCLDAGMDGYISKPINADELFEAIESLVSPSLEETRQSRESVEAIDRVAVMRRFSDPELMQAVLDIFLESHEDLLAQAREAIAKGDEVRLERAAHSLKGAISNFQAAAAVEIAMRLEMMGREKKLSDASRTLAELEAEIERIKPELLALADEWTLQTQSD